MAECEVLTAVVMKNTNFWDIMLCDSLEVSRCFRGIYHHHLEGYKINHARNQSESRWQAELVSFFYPGDGGDMFLRNVG
jgi:hypothetical protein